MARKSLSLYLSRSAHKEGGSVRFLLMNMLGCTLSFFRARGSSGATVAALLLSSIAAGLIFVNNASTVGAQQYLAYADSEKPVIFHILSDEQNVAELMVKFALSDAHVKAVLNVTRTENEALARVYGQSQRIIEVNSSLPKKQVSAKIRDSGDRRSVRRVVAQTRSTAERLFPSNRRAEFRAWVNDKGMQKRQEFNEEPEATYQAQATAYGMWFKVFATQY